VCGSNNKTYKSVCHMDADACATRKKIKVVKYSECSRSSEHLCDVLV